MSILGSILDGVNDFLDFNQKSSFQTFLNNVINRKNYDLSLANYNFNRDSYLRNFEYQKNLQQQIFNREDNAVQRRALDLEKAGLSKTLAAGDGAGAGSVVSTSPSSLSAPSHSPVDLISAGLNVQRALTEMKKIQADTENAYKQNEVMDSQILNDEYQRNYILVKTAIERGNLDMLGLTREEKIASIDLYKAQKRSLDEQILASMQNRKISDYKLSVLLPQQFQRGVEEIANLKKQGLIYDADLKYRNMQSDLLVYDINEALFSSRIRELDYYYQVNTGFKPRSATPLLGDVMSATESGGYKQYLDWLQNLGKNFFDGYSKIIQSFNHDNTPK